MSGDRFRFFSVYIIFFVRVSSFSVSFEKTDRIMSIFLCVLTRTEKSRNFSVGFRIFLSGFLKCKFFCVYREKRTEKFITHRNIRVSSSVWPAQTHSLDHLH